MAEVSSSYFSEHSMQILLPTLMFMPKLSEVELSPVSPIKGRERKAPLGTIPAPAS